MAVSSVTSATFMSLLAWIAPVAALAVVGNRWGTVAVLGVEAEFATKIQNSCVGVVVDTAPGLSEHTLAVLDQTDILVLVTSLDVPGVRGLRKELDTLRDIGLLLESRAVVLNFMHPSRGISVSDVEASIGRKVDLQLPQSNSVPISVNQGIPLLQSGSRDPVAKQLRALVDLVDQNEKAAAKGRRFFDFGHRKEAQQ